MRRLLETDRGTFPSVEETERTGEEALKEEAKHKEWRMGWYSLYDPLLHERR
ncbi:hypothetical protein OOT00_06540 [Desulfobotulus sp. H1]|uniref:Uncharacterized protein n=1 Tax=Desulfobotulus pelophilus TaxID=2823377 RepID=A0ABT3N854_9BACT|nr:hypothetical protein [Desulfobotulus pelophilus]MCW7753641.1 hypothetical protein [Desulfobotulus pelophilus]